ncbi:hypothetical protein DL89DRAFT_269265 [Linderina pennispora]|uniref:F-box domain-containing protein n=1 Tax=Linderina pennispora TaxID=61395 RepID=A0A1Y1W2T6_9FUNG|nr:uncharacterized protein DL89DRAFT_269265 [Linderina pennispora]ORX67454.1 hypothetical protein DL89DRAFT_269265 [Linderina pennispora]
MSVDISSLPPHIIELIIEYTSGVLRGTVRTYDKSPTGIRPSFMPFLSICRHWRLTALQLLYQEVVDETNLGFAMLTEDHCWLPTLLTAVTSGAEGLVKSVAMNHSCTDILNGTVAQQLAAGATGDAVFLKPVDLQVILTGLPDSNSDIDSAMAAQEIARTTAQLNRLFPHIQRCYLGMDIGPQHHHRKLLMEFAASMASRAASVTFIDAYFGPGVCELPFIANLENITLFDLSLGGSFFELLYRSAATLKSIELVNATSADFLHLIQHDGGSLIIYPNLQALSIELDDDDVTTRYDLPPGKPFPALKHVKCKHHYPFAQDILVEPNTETLETITLDMPEASPPIITLVDGHVHSQYPHLHCVNLTWDYTSENKSEEWYEHAITSEFSISSHLQQLMIDFWFLWDTDWVLTILKDSICAANLRILDITTVRFSYAQVISLIGLLPNITKLSLCLDDHQGNNSLEDEYNLHLDEVQKVRGTHYPLGRDRLFELDVNLAIETSNEATIDRLVLLISLIPSLKRVYVSYSLEPYLGDIIETLMKTPKYAEFADHIQSISYFFR